MFSPAFAQQPRTDKAPGKANRISRRHKETPGGKVDIPEDDVLSLVGMVYEAALDERKWPSFLQAFARAVGGNPAFLRAANLQTGATEFVANAGYDPAWREAYCNHFIKLDYLTPAVSRLGLCEAKTGEHVLSLPEQRKTEYSTITCSPRIRCMR